MSETWEGMLPYVYLNLLSDSACRYPLLGVAVKHTARPLNPQWITVCTVTHPLSTTVAQCRCVTGTHMLLGRGDVLTDHHPRPVHVSASR